MFVHTFPREDNSLKSQTELTDVDDETYRRGYTPPISSTLDRVIQILFFILFFGWLRLLLLIVVAIVFAIGVIPLGLASDHEALRLLLLPPTMFFSRHVILPLIRLCLGFFRVRIHGKPHPDARCFVYDHTCLFDGPFLYTFWKLTIVIHAGIKRVPILGPAIKGAGTLFIDRSSREGNGKVIIDAMNDPDTFPLVIAPEAKISNGDYMFRFRTGAFLTDKTIQPLTMRYTHFLPVANITPNALPDNDLEWGWLCLCCPWTTLDITFLEPMLPEQLIGKTPREKADMAQLVIANALGTLAISRTSQEIFTKPKKE